MTRRPSHITALAAALLAVAIAAGVSTPRLRAGGRERAARGTALSGSTRPDQPCAWIEPDDSVVDASARAGDLVFDTRAVAPETGGDPFVFPPGRQVGWTPASTAVDVLPVHLAHDLLIRRPPAARGPPSRPHLNHRRLRPRSPSTRS